MAEVILRKKDRAGGINLPDFRLHYKATVIKMVHYWYKNRAGWGVEISGTGSKAQKETHALMVIVYDKGVSKLQWKKTRVCNKWCWSNWTAACKRMKLEHSRTPYTKINSK